MPRVRLAALLPLTLAVIVHVVATAQSDRRAGDDAVQKFLSFPESPHSYRAQRRLEASGGGLKAWIEAETDFTPAEGLRYDVTAGGGSGLIRSRVLVSVLDEERQLIARGATGTVALSRDNYRFAPGGISEEGLARIELQPLRRERTLLVGELFVKPEDGELVRLDGRLAKNPSFWTTKVDVVRLYGRINGVVMPVSLQSIAQLRLFGKSTFRMTYTYLEIDNHPVHADDPVLSGAP